MNETEVKIPLSGSSLYIYGTLRGDYKNPLIILCHGYGGWMHEMLLYNAARYFEKEGFATLRLSMYGGGDKSRNISNSDIMTHASDIDEVVSFARKSGAKWTAVVGHSYSGMAIVYSKQQRFDAAALWDPTHTDAYVNPESILSLQEDYIFIEEMNAYVSGNGSGTILAKSVINNNYPESAEMAAKFKISTCVINASWSEDQQKYGKDYANNIDAKSKQVIIPDSSHPFTEDGAAEKLFAATAQYFNGTLSK